MRRYGLCMLNTGFINLFLKNRRLDNNCITKGAHNKYLMIRER